MSRPQLKIQDNPQSASLADVRCCFHAAMSTSVDHTDEAVAATEAKPPGADHENGGKNIVGIPYLGANGLRDQHAADGESCEY
jgi:hypothetical protein